MRRIRRDDAKARLAGLMADPAAAWAPYQPDDTVPWNRAAVAHLHRRAGFAPSWAIVERDLADGPEASLGRILDGEPQSLDGRPAAAFETEQDATARRFGGADADVSRLQALWLHRMVLTPHPLRERMTLFWHDHFATSNAKVRNASLMRRQNALLRQHALGDFKAMLQAMAQDPAMLLFLDSATNRKAHPNENYAREVMELFTLGRGHYTEKDIQEAARAFTGSFIQNDRFHEVAAQHDPGDKTILGQTGPFRGDDVARILLAQPTCADYLCGKLFRAFLSEVDEPSSGLVEPLAARFRESGYNIRVPVETILRSRLFHDPAMHRRRVKCPVELAVGTVRALEMLRPTVPPQSLATSTAAMGQALFEPPSVAGWDWGPAWISTTTTLARTNFALDLISDNPENNRRLDPAGLASRHGQGAAASAFYADLLLQDGADAALRGRLPGDPREAARLILAAPEYQLA
jgi:uncharacterized protein (DUF1800 family)